MKYLYIGLPGTHGRYAIYNVIHEDKSHIDSTFRYTDSQNPTVGGLILLRKNDAHYNNKYCLRKV
jgi:hypothetical protein